jgi:hypothetical protein
VKDKGAKKSRGLSRDLGKVAPFPLLLNRFQQLVLFYRQMLGWDDKPLGDLLISQPQGRSDIDRLCPEDLQFCQCEGRHAVSRLCHRHRRTAPARPCGVPP